MNDDNPLNGEREQVEIITYSTKRSTPKIGTVRMMMRMALGGAIIGREELKRRFQEEQSVTFVSAATLNKETPIENEADRARYAAIGAMAKSSDALRRRIAALGRVSNRTFSRLTRTFDPVTNSRLLSPFRRQYQRYTDHGDKIVSEWIATGRREEYLSRQLVQDTTVEAIEETLDYLAESPELDELVQQQSGDYIEDMFDDVQESASNTTLVLADWFTSTILRRPSLRTESTSDRQSQKSDQSQDQAD
jgi:transposase-like protein